MSWFKVDDTAHTHPKLRGAGTAAIGLWTLGGSYAAQYLTDGIVHAHFVKANATSPQVAKLVKAGLWHPAGHSCPRCPQPAEGDYLMHDYLIYNPTRAKVLSERERAAEKKRKQRAGADGSQDSETNQDRFESESKRNRGRFEDDSMPKSSPNIDELPGQRVVSPGDSLGTRAPARPGPSRSTSYGSTASGDDRDRTGGVPDRLAPLRDALAAAGLGAVAWDIKKFTDWERIRIQMERLGIDLMVKSALAAAKSRGEPDNVAAWIGRWESLADPKPAARETPKPNPRAAWPEWCKDPDCDEITRTRQIENDNGIRSLIRCQQCHPNRKEPAA